MIRVVAKSIVPIDKQEEYRKIVSELIAMSRSEKGCISYGLFKDRDNPEILTILEEWKDEDSLERHSATDHFKRIVPALGKLRDGNDVHVYIPVE